eukprot:6093203-Pyramimonas_sp.AAC.1
MPVRGPTRARALDSQLNVCMAVYGCCIGIYGCTVYTHTHTHRLRNIRCDACEEARIRTCASWSSAVSAGGSAPLATPSFSLSALFSPASCASATARSSA